jgi:NAD-dependent DNA ligase
MDKTEELRKMLVPDNVLGSIFKEELDDLYKWCKASEAYYSKVPIMDDDEFDELEERLLSFDNEYLYDFITKSIYDIKGFKDRWEDHEMVSLKKIKTSDPEYMHEIFKFIRENNIYNSDVYYGPKFDGVSLKITWEKTIANGGFQTFKIKQILSRGGIDVTEKLENHPDIRKSFVYIKDKPSDIVCGELMIKKQTFVDKYSEDFKNPRNFVGKLIKEKKVSEDVINDLSFEACTDGINILITEKNWWKVINREDFWGNLTALFQPFKTVEFPYLCDGFVIAFKAKTRQIKNNYPLNMFAIKFPAPQATTEVLDIEWSQKKSGKLCPVFLLKPVPLDGITATKASGYNYSIVKTLGAGIGSIIKIERSGDIIPIIKSVIRRSMDIKMPDVEYTIAGKHLIAVDLERSKIYKFVLGLALLKLDGIGETLAEQIGKVVDYDIIELFDTKHRESIFSILNGGKTFQKFIELYNIKSLYLDQIINLLQFDNVGPVLSKKLAMLISGLSTNKANISNDVLHNVAAGKGFQLIKESIAKLKIMGIAVLKPLEINESTITYEMSVEEGESINIGGQKISKSQYELLLKKKYPNAIHTTLTKTTKYLFVNSVNSDTRKANQARKYNIKMLTFEDGLNINLE